MKKFIAIILMLVSFSAFANPLDTKCPQHTFRAYPVIKTTTGIQYACRTKYAVAFDNKAHIPVYTASYLNKNELNGSVVRTDNFHKDLEFVGSATKTDYAKPYDKGHLSEAELFTTDPIAMEESFLMTNMHPQYAGVNRGVWQSVEDESRRLTNLYGEVYIITGTAYSKTSPTIGRGVVVPSHTWKVIYVPATKSIHAYAVPNDASSVGVPFKSFKTTTRQIEILTGLKF